MSASVRGTPSHAGCDPATYLAQLRSHHAETWRHCVRAASVVRQLALAFGLPPADAAEYGEAASLHDIGKCRVSPGILSKPGRLTDAEMVEVCTHSQSGFMMLQQGRGTLFHRAARMALGHHERWDGFGYPYRLSGTAIPAEARLMAVADCYEALRAPRAYKEGWDHEATARWLRDGAGRQFDPAVVEAFEASAHVIERHWGTTYAELPEPGGPPPAADMGGPGPR